MLSKPSTKHCSNLGTVSRMFWKSCSFCSRVFLATCVRWYCFVLFDLGIFCVCVYARALRYKGLYFGSRGGRGGGIFQSRRIWRSGGSCVWEQEVEDGRRQWIAGRKDTQIEGVSPNAHLEIILSIRNFGLVLIPVKAGWGGMVDPPVTEPSLFRNGPDSMSTPGECINGLFMFIVLNLPLNRRVGFTVRDADSLHP